MSLRGLSQFQKFDLEGFIKDKRIEFKKVEPWNDYNDHSELGTKVVCEIDIDNTKYKNEDVNNENERLIVKVRKPLSDFEKIKKHSTIKIKNVEKAVVWGQYNNQLSLVADIEVVKD